MRVSHLHYVATYRAPTALIRPPTGIKTLVLQYIPVCLLLIYLDSLRQVKLRSNSLTTCTHMFFFERVHRMGLTDCMLYTGACKMGLTELTGNMLKCLEPISHKSGYYHLHFEWSILSLSLRFLKDARTRELLRETGSVFCFILQHKGAVIIYGRGGSANPKIACTKNLPPPPLGTRALCFCPPLGS